MTNLRVGHGYDVHRLVSGRKLILGGVEIPFEKGLDGHSDADVLTHAVMDALLGACGLGDIGRHFPDTDERYRGISSLLLLDHVATLLRQQGYGVVNVDVTLLAQAPKVGPYRQQMVENLATHLGITPEQINVKATTEEHLGFTGSGEGMACHAVALVEKL
jgi:2-C-methyl-D-erythritol 2,4-cyclodiphosphate synthase